AIIDVAGYGSGRQLRATWAGADWSAAPALTTSDGPPGTTAVARGRRVAVAANPLLDAWIARQEPGRDPVIAPVPTAVSDSRSVEHRVGEALMFTTLMAPWNRADGRWSRFTCETCHFEGYGDGRIHYTGRGQIHASTKPLRGLFNNRPHFSRALDRTMAIMVHAEFRVANRGNGRSPWFALRRAEMPWLSHLGAVPESLSPQFLRRSLMTFLMEFPHRPNPAAMGWQRVESAPPAPQSVARADAPVRRFTADERRGAELFRDRCEMCHSARTVADIPASRVAFADWERLTLTPTGGIVWGRDEHYKTGVVPYVHPDGARVPSLRRLYKKWPYFTNGSAEDLAEVLERARFVRAGSGADNAQPAFYHDGGPPAASILSRAQRDALLAFLRLL
ncbi:MAG: c-type cytochrome, partial [Myxococcota bacterium]